MTTFVTSNGNINVDSSNGGFYVKQYFKMGNIVSRIKERVRQRRRERQRNSRRHRCVLKEVTAKHLLYDSAMLNCTPEEEDRPIDRRQYWRSPYEGKSYIQPVVYSISANRDFGIGEISSLCHKFRYEDDTDLYEQDNSDGDGNERRNERGRVRNYPLVASSSGLPSVSRQVEASESPVDQLSSDSTEIDSDPGTSESNGTLSDPSSIESRETPSDRLTTGSGSPLDEPGSPSLEDGSARSQSTGPPVSEPDEGVENRNEDNVSSSSSHSEYAEIRERSGENPNPNQSGNTVCVKSKDAQVTRFPEFVTPFLNRDVRIRLSFHKAVFSAADPTYSPYEPVHLWRHVKHVDARFLCHPLQNRIKIMLEESHGSRRTLSGPARRWRSLYPRAIILNTGQETPGLYVAGKEFSIMLSPPPGGARLLDDGRVLFALGTYVRYLDTDRNYLMLWRASIVEDMAEDQRLGR